MKEKLLVLLTLLGVVLVLLAGLIFFFINSSCEDVTVFEKVPVITGNSIMVTEPYTYQQPTTEELCDYEFNNKVTYEDSVWDGNTLRRIATIHNSEEENGLFTFTKVYYLNGNEIARDDPPSEVVVEKKGKRTLFLAWNTVFNKDKEIAIEIVSTSERKSPNCKRVVKYINMTGFKNITKIVNDSHTQVQFKKKKICK